MRTARLRRVLVERGACGPPRLPRKRQSAETSECMRSDNRKDTRRQYTEAAKEVAPILVGLFVALLGTDPFNARGRSHLLTLFNRLALAFLVATILLVLWPLVLP